SWKRVVATAYVQRRKTINARSGCTPGRRLRFRYLSRRRPIDDGQVPDEAVWEPAGAGRNGPRRRSHGTMDSKGDLRNTLHVFPIVPARAFRQQALGPGAAVVLFRAAQLQREDSVAWLPGCFHAGARGL